MSKIKIEGNASGTGTLTIAAPNTNTDRTLSLPDSTGTLVAASGGVLPALDGSNLTNLPGGGKILQFVHAIDRDSSTQSVAARTWVSLNNISATITPSSTSSKIFIIARVAAEWSGPEPENGNVGVYRDSTLINYGTDVPSSPGGTWSQGIAKHIDPHITDNNTSLENYSVQTVDSPSTTSAITYKVAYANSNEGATMYYNRSITTNNQNTDVGSSEIILMEIGA